MLILRGTDLLWSNSALAVLLCGWCLLLFVLAITVRHRVHWVVWGVILCGLLVLSEEIGAVITLRAEKGEALTHEELDENFVTLQNWQFTNSGPWTLDPAGSCTNDLTRIPSAAGAMYPTIQCTAAATDRLFSGLNLAPVGWITGSIFVRVLAVHTGAAPGGSVLGLTIDAQCMKDGVVSSNTWGSGQTVSLTFTTQNMFRIATATLTPGGTCGGSTEAVPTYVTFRVSVNTALTNCTSNCPIVQIDHRFTRP